MRTYERRYLAKKEPDTGKWYVLDTKTKLPWTWLTTGIKAKEEAELIAAALNSGAIRP